MACYIAMERGGLDAMADGAARGERPRHAMADLATATGAQIEHPAGENVVMADRLLARLVGTPELWAFSRALRRRLSPGDVVYCGSEAIGFPVAAMCGHTRRGAQVVVLVHNVVRLRASVAIRLLGLRRRVATFLAVSSRQTAHLSSLGVPTTQARTIADQTDIRYFTPGPRAATQRPVLMSVGLEQRDYRTVAAATADLDVDVRISGFSSDAVAIANAFPARMPANMTRDYYEWGDLLALYRSAAVVVVSLFANSYAAGVQVLLEAIACGRPVIVTRTDGLADYLDRPDLITTVPAGDAAAMRHAILAKLGDPAAAEAQAAARDHFLPIIDSARYVREIADCIAHAAGGASPARAERLVSRP